MTRPPILTWALLALGIVYLLFIGGEPAGVQLSQLRIISVAAIAVALAAWWFVAARDPLWRPRSVFLPAIAACIASMAISTITSRSPRVSLEYLAYAVLWGFLYVLLVQLLGRAAIRERILALASLSGILISLLFMAAVVVIWFGFWSALGRFAAPPLRPNTETLVFGNPAVILVMVVLLGAVCLGWLAGRPRMRGAAIGLAALLFGATAFLTGTRGGWVAIGAGILGLTLATAYGVGPRRAFRSARQHLARRGRMPVAAAVLVVAGAAVALTPAILRRLATTEGNRFEFYRIALQMFNESPLTGVGPGMWVAQRIAYTRSPAADEYVPHAHDLYLQGLAEMGLLGALAGVIAISTLIWLVRDGLRDADPARRRWALVVSFTSAYFGVHQLVDFFANAPATFAVFAIPIAILDATRTARPRRFSDRLTAIRSRWGMRLGAMLAAGALLLAAAVEVPALVHADAVAEANAGQWTASQPLAHRAAALDPEMPVYHLTAGLAAAHVSDYRTAAIEFRLIAEASDLPEAWLDLADAYAEIGERDSALDALHRAGRLGLAQPAVSIATVGLANDLGDHELATFAAVAAIESLPSLVTDPWWATTPERTSIRADAIRALESSDNVPARWQVAMYDGRYTDARLAASMLPGEVSASALLVIRAWNGEAAAGAELQADCRANPFDPILWWCATVASRAGDEQSAERFRDLGLASAVPSDVSYGIRILEAPHQIAVGGNNAFLFGIQTYRRFTPWDMLSPGLLHLGTE